MNDKERALQLARECGAEEHGAYHETLLISFDELTAFYRRAVADGLEMAKQACRDQQVSTESTAEGDMSEHGYDEPPAEDCDCRRCAIATRNALRHEVARLRGAATHAYCVLSKMSGEDAEIAALTLRHVLTPNAGTQPRLSEARTSAGVPCSAADNGDTK